MTEEKKEKIKTVIRGILSGVLILYLGAAIFMTHRLHAGENIRKVNIFIEPNSTGQPFVTQNGLRTEIKSLPEIETPVSQVDISAIEQEINEIVNVEKAQIELTSGGDFNVFVTPMIPVARVFNSNGFSYYINREGKKLTADARYHIDVPIITGRIDDNVLSTLDILPVINYVSLDPLWNSLTTAFKVNENHDLLLIPSIKGHVVNLGNPLENNLDDKFARLLTIYREVLPRKGWQFYDTISVKFNGQVVASRTQKTKPIPDLIHELVDHEEETIDNMSTWAPDH